jgi:hypothetical protein
MWSASTFRTSPITRSGRRSRPGYRWETRSVPLAVRVRPLLAPLTVNVNVPRGFKAVLIVRTEFAVGVTEVDENEPADPDGNPATDSATAPEYPFRDVTLAV